MPQTVPLAAVRVVIADDQAEFREYIRTMLARATSVRFEVVGEAGDGARAMELVRALGPDAVISDLYMPEMDGFELQRAVQSEFPDVTVVLVSALIRSTNIDRPVIRKNIQKTGAVPATNVLNPPRYFSQGSLSNPMNVTMASTIPCP